MSQIDVEMMQVELQHGETYQVVWIPVSLGVKTGAIVVGKDTIEWSVLHTYPNFTLEQQDVRKDWRVGGML